MDSLFRVVSLESSSDQYYNYNNNNHSHSFNNSTITNSSSSRSSNKIQHTATTTTTTTTPTSFHPQNDVEECFNFFMDEEDLSSSSNSATHNKHQPPSSSSYFPNYHQYQTPLLTPTHQHHHHGSFDQYSNYPSDQFSYSPAQELSQEFFSDRSSSLLSSSSSSSSSSRWGSDVLLETSRAVADKDTGRTQQLMWMLNELSSPYGDVDQKLSYYFLQALFTRITESAGSNRCYRTMVAASEKISSFDSTRKTVLKFQEVSPWTTFGHVASNGAILEALDGEPTLHIIDISTTFCTQWPTLLEAIATRSDDTPHLRLTTVVVNKTATETGESSGVQRVMREIGSRMEKFARLMGVPFQFHVIHHNADLSELNFADLGVQDDEAVAINCVNTLHSVAGGRRDAVLAGFRSLRPRVVTVVEEEADLDVGADGYEFVRGFQESVRWFRVYLEALEESFPRTSNERLMLERAAGRAVMDLMTCPEGESGERREVAARWGRRMAGAGMTPLGFSDEVSDDVRALLKRYKEGWSMVQSPEAAPGMFLAWKDQPVVWASAWKP